MRAIVERIEQSHAPLIKMYIHHAPHRRQHIRVIQQYREGLGEAAKTAGLSVPIKGHIELWVLFIEPCSCDLDNLIVALFRAMDGKTLKGPTILATDEQITKVTAAILRN